MATLTPIRKVRAGTAGGAVATITTWLFGLIGWHLPPALLVPAAALVTAGTAYLAHSAPGEASPAPVPEQSRNLFDPGPID